MGSSCQSGVRRISAGRSPRSSAQSQAGANQDERLVTYRDLLTVKGAYGSKQKFPFVPLSDGVGEVVAISGDVIRVKVGDRVAGIFMQTWLSGDLSAEKSKSALGGAIDGVLAEYVT